MAKQKEKTVPAKSNQTKQEKAPAEKAQQRTQQPLRFRSKDDGKLEPDSDDEFLWYSQLCEALGVDDTDLALTIMAQAGDANAAACKNPETEANKTLSALQHLAPGSLLEAMLAAQMLAVHNASMKMLSRAAIPDQTQYGIDANITRATKLQRTFLAQIEAWNKLRGKSGQQKVTVEHVHVHEGGQAVVGNVEGGRGSDGK